MSRQAAATSFRPTRRAAALPLGALALFAVGTNVQAGWVLTMAALVAGFWIAGLVLPSRALRGLDVERHAPARIRAGDPVTVRVLVHNGARRPRGIVRVTDEFCGTASGVIGAFPSGETTELRGQRTGARRGVHMTGMCRLESGAPFGVLVARRTIKVPSRIVVVPRTFELRATGAADEGAMTVRRPAGDVSSVRGYRPGDPVRHIHWRSTARRGELVVREFEEPEEGGTVLVGASMPEDERHADAVASAACSYAIDALAAGRDVLLLPAEATDPPVTPAHSTQTILEWGARLGAATPPLASSLTRAPSTGAVVCALGDASRADPGTVDAVRTLGELEGAGRDVLAVNVTARRDGTGPSAVGGLGIRMVELSCEEIEAWCGTVSEAS